MIPPDFIQQLLGRIDIVDVVDKHVKLKKAGQNYSACCPFHSEKTPSFSVSPTKQFYHCFGCGAHGTAIGFLMEYSGMGFRDAVRELAEGVGMTMPVETHREENRVQANQAASLNEVMEKANQFFRQQLKQSTKAIDYLKGRGLTGEIAAAFELGYAPDDWQGLHAVFEDYSIAALKECGLVIDNEEGRRYDRFRDRIMFPIHDARGNVIGFGGRVIGPGEPKYLNSPETPLFEKGRELYGLFQARRAIRDSSTVIVVEGYMDVVALAQSEVRNAVATLGTATTPMHVEKLMRMADNLVFCFDGDSAGRRAAWRALEQSLPVVMDGKDIRFLFLPAEDDPDTFVRRVGREVFLSEVTQAKSLSAYLFDELSSQVGLDTEEGRARLLALAKPLISQITAPALGLMIRKRLAELMGIEAHELARLLPPIKAGEPRSHDMQDNSVRRSGHATYAAERRYSHSPVLVRKQPMPGAELQLLACIFMRPALAARFDIDVEPTDSSLLGVVSRVVAYVRDHELEVTPAMIVEHFRGSADYDEVMRAARDKRYELLDVAKIDLETDFAGALATIREAIILQEKQAQELERALKLGLN